MTKLSSVIGLCVIAMLLAAGMYYVSGYALTSSSDTSQLTALSARKEDLLANQIQIEEQLAALNESVQQALIQQQALDQQIGKLSTQVGVPKPVTVVTPAPVAPVAPVVIPTPVAPTPVRRVPVTRAS